VAGVLSTVENGLRGAPFPGSPDAHNRTAKPQIDESVAGDADAAECLAIVPVAYPTGLSRPGQRRPTRKALRPFGSGGKSAPAALARVGRDACLVLGSCEVFPAPTEWLAEGLSSGETALRCDAGLDLADETGAVVALEFPEVVGDLEVEPVPGVDAEKSAEAGSGVGRDGAAAAQLRFGNGWRRGRISPCSLGADTPPWNACPRPAA
jgi:hypothetical protein